MESHVSGASMWRSLESQIEFILTHPNGWEGPQQQQIRRAAEIAGLVPAGEDGQSRLHLLMEGEASLHFCVTTVLASDTHSKIPILCSDDSDEYHTEEDCQGVAIIDAGGGTVDMSLYSMTFAPSVSVKEIAPAECKCLKYLLRVQDSQYVLLGRLQGSVFVTLRAQQFLQSGYIMNALLSAFH